MNTTIIFGPPGTGKTTRLLSLVEQEIADGVDPKRIAFVSFTKAAVSEAMSRAMTKFNLTKRQLPWFRTLHSLAFAALGCDREAMLTDYSAFGTSSGLRFSRARKEEALYSETCDGDIFLAARSLCAATGQHYDQVQRGYGVKMSGFRYERICKILDDYKVQVKKLEYHDLLANFLSECTPLNVDVAFVDEAQDLTSQQWLVVAHAFKSAKRMYVAGDDDQAIYEWAGADAGRMITLQGEQIVLDHSYRLPEVLHSYANQISSRIKMRKYKLWRGNASAGELHHWFSWRDLEFSNDESWMVLARANQFLPALAEALELAGVAYSWCGSPRIKVDLAKLYVELKTFLTGAPLKGSRVMRLLDQSRTSKHFTFKPGEQVTVNAPGLDSVDWFGRWPHARLQYFNRVWQRYGALETPHTVELTTIHQAKGTEAENVVLCPDVPAAAQTSLSDAEHRVFYVGATRAKRRLFVLKPQQENFYRLPKST